MDFDPDVSVHWVAMVLPESSLIGVFSVKVILPLDDCWDVFWSSVLGM